MRHGSAPALSRLVQLVEKTPLEAPRSRRASQLAAACARREADSPLAGRPSVLGSEWTMAKIARLAAMLAARALEAARRQTDNTFYLAMIREQGERALDKGDRDGAEAAWGRMLDIVVSPTASKVKKPVERHRQAPPMTTSDARRPGKAPPRRERASCCRRGEDRFVRLASFQEPRRPARAEEPRLARRQSATAARQRDRTAAATGKPLGRPGAAGTTGPGAARPPRDKARPHAGNGSIELADPDARSVRAGHADRPAGGRARPAGAQLQGRARLASRRPAGRADEHQRYPDGAGCERGRSMKTSSDPASPRVVANLVQLDPIWQKHKFAPAAVYEVAARRGHAARPGRRNCSCTRRRST